MLSYKKKCMCLNLFTSKKYFCLHYRALRSRKLVHKSYIYWASQEVWPNFRSLVGLEIGPKSECKVEGSFPLTFLSLQSHSNFILFFF